MDITVSIYKSDNNPYYYVAHCLDYDLVATDQEPSKAVEKLLIIVDKYLKSGGSSYPAPIEFWPDFPKKKRFKK